MTEEVDPKTQEVIEVQEDDTEHVHEPIKPVEEKPIPDRGWGDGE